MKRLFSLLILAALLPSAASAFTVKGGFFYEDRIYDGDGYTGTVQNLPIRHARVEIVNSVDLAVLASGSTNEFGQYAVSVDGQTTPVNLYARCVTDGGDVYYITVVDAAERDLMGGWLPPDAPLHAITTDTVLLHDPALDYDFGDFVIQDADGTGVAQAFNVFDCAVDFFDLVAQPGLLGHLPESANYVSYGWGPNNANEGSNYTQNTILLSSPGQGNDTDGWSDTVILHETGHWFDDNYSATDNPGGAHFLGDNDANVLLAYGEGSATYHCAKVRERRALVHGTDGLVSLYADLVIPPPVGTPGGLSFSYDFETGTLADDGTPLGQIGSANETNVTSALWDMLDGAVTPDASPGLDDDPMEVGDEYAWAIERTYLTALSPNNPITVEDYWQGWFALNGPGFMQAQMEQIFVTLALMPFAADAFEEDDEIGSAGSIAPAAYSLSASGKVVINEIELGAKDAVELMNTGETPVDLGGWQIEVYANDIAPGDPPTIYTFAPRTLDPGETVTLHEAGSPVDNGSHHVYAGDQQTFNAPWNSGVDGAVVVRDAGQQAIDFVKWRAADGTENNTPVPAGLAFTGVLDTPPAPQTLARDINGLDTDNASDFTGHYGSLGSVNHPSPQSHTIFDLRDGDVIRFEAVAGTRYGFETKGPYSKSDPRLQLLTADGGVVGSNDNLQSSVRDARLDFYAVADGTFYVRVSHVGMQTDYAEYQLLAFVRPPSEALTPPAGLSASAVNASDTQDEVVLQWANGRLYDTVRVYRGGAQIDEIPGTDVSYTDHADRGLQHYEISGVLGGTETSRVGAYEFAGLLSCFAADDFESGNADLWVREESAPGSRWDVVAFAQAGAWGFSDSPPGVPYRGCPGGSSGCKMNAIAELGLPALLTPNALLEWDQICITEATYDFCIVEITADDGVTWSELARYDQSFDPAWEDNVADPTDWRHASVALAPYAGEEVRIRFRLESDTNLEFDGWYVDNVRVNDPVCLTASAEDLFRAGAVRLLPASPNPACGPALLSFILPAREERVEIAIFDAGGRVVRSERMGPQEAGIHAWTWDGRDARGRTAPSGVYHARLSAGAKSLTRKLVRLAP